MLWHQKCECKVKLYSFSIKKKRIGNSIFYDYYIKKSISSFSHFIHNFFLQQWQWERNDLTFLMREGQLKKLFFFLFHVGRMYNTFYTLRITLYINVANCTRSILLWFYEKYLSLCTMSWMYINETLARSPIIIINLNSILHNFILIEFSFGCYCYRYYWMKTGWRHMNTRQYSVKLLDIFLLAVKRYNERVKICHLMEAML